MRQRHTYLLQLVVDEAEPTVLRGRLHHVASASATPFTGGEQLLALLQAQLAARRAAPPERTPQAQPPPG